MSELAMESQCPWQHWAVIYSYTDHAVEEAYVNSRLSQRSGPLAAATVGPDIGRLQLQSPCPPTAKFWRNFGGTSESRVTHPHRQPQSMAL